MKFYKKSFFAVAGLALTGPVQGQGVSEFSFVERRPQETDGECKIDVRLQDEGESLDGVPPWHPDDNIVVTLAGDTCDVGVSPTWTIGDWKHTIIQIAPNATFEAPRLRYFERHAIKLARGVLLDVSYDGIFKDGHWETYVVSTPNRAVPFWIDSNKRKFKAGPDGAVMVYMKVKESALQESITDMESGPVTIMKGPYMEGRPWVRCNEPFGEAFDDIEFYNFAGMKIQENDGKHLMYMQHWTLREDANADAYHNGHPFGEIHMALYTANKVSGMQTFLPGTQNLNVIPNPEDATSATWFNNDDPGVQISMPWGPGVGHGPIWSINPETGEPIMNCDGAVHYPLHRHLISANGPANEPLRYTMWTAFEHPVEHVTVPLNMLTSWPNAYIQTSEVPDCNAQPPSTPVDAVME